ncbi:hypothetical protein BDP27DRAFT_32829 [Rhodocollybia butyracea]|uniref:Uncharacterized protein n=1 Tax=Rhodocollybia butyracea TaxID=206335 RepID=A0A9P5UEB1_9AGAR|nr:hypothetical protein BDP27DRAFT_32829 [Rhodocollybia butyracea]
MGLLVKTIIFSHCLCSSEEFPRPIGSFSRYFVEYTHYDGQQLSPSNSWTPGSTATENEMLKWKFHAAPYHYLYVVTRNYLQKPLRQSYHLRSWLEGYFNNTDPKTSFVTRLLLGRLFYSSLGLRSAPYICSAPILSTLPRDFSLDSPTRFPVSR